MTLLLVALGGGMGAAVRFLVSRLLDAHPERHQDNGRRLHWGTLAANVSGSFLLGFLLGGGVSEQSMSLWGVGFSGGLTTYSSFAVQTVQHERRPAAAYVVLTVAGCLAAAWLGLHL